MPPQARIRPKALFPADARFEMRDAGRRDACRMTVIDTRASDDLGRRAWSFVRLAEDGRRCSSGLLRTEDEHDAIAPGWGPRSAVWGLPEAQRRAVCGFVSGQGGPMSAWDGRSLGFPHDAECGLPAAVGDGSDGDLVQVWNESAGVVTAARKLGMRPEDLWRRAQTLRERGHVLALRTWTPRRRRGPARKPYAPKGMPALAQIWLGRVSDRALADSLDPPRASSTVRRWRMALRIPPWRGHAPAGMRIDLADGMGAP